MSKEKGGLLYVLISSIVGAVIAGYISYNSNRISSVDVIDVNKDNKPEAVVIEQLYEKKVLMPQGSTYVPIDKMTKRDSPEERLDSICNELYFFYNKL